MPIRRAAATPSQEKAPAAAADKEPEASEESPPAEEEEEEAAAAPADGDEKQKAAADDEEEEPTENGEKVEEGAAAEEGEQSKKDEKCEDCAAGQCSKHCYVLLLRMKDGYKYKKSRTKKVKRTIPLWASIAAHKNLPVTNFAGTQHRMDNILIEALRASSDKSGVSFKSLMKYLLDKHPGMELSKKTFFIKKALKKHLEKGTIKQLKGKGLSGSFVIGKQPAPPKKPPNKLESLGDALPLIITQLCEPKEASYSLIKKYLEQHFPSLNIENRPEALKTALVKAVEKGHLEQITGKGARGTFQLKRGGNKPQLKGSVLEEAITVAITAMNEPKTCSTTLLRKHLLDSHKDMKEHLLMATLRRTLKKCKVLGWMEQITGHGFTGTYRLSFPFYPSPNTLFPDKFKEPVKTPTKRRRTMDSSDEEEDSEEDSEEEEESEDEAPPPKRLSKKRPPPKVRRPPPAKKARSSGPVKGRGKALAKKSPAKKAPPPAKKAPPPAKKGGRKQPASKKEASAPKETPVKKAAPSRKPKTPAVKKLSARGSKRPPPKESTPEKEDKTAKGRSRSSKPEESSPEEPAAKKQPTKGASKLPEPKKTPATGKSGAKSSKQPARKSKRGRR